MSDEIGALAGENTGDEGAMPDGSRAERTRSRRLMDSLSAEQRRALVLLADGKQLPAVAKECGVHRTTVYRWITADPYFRAAYNAWQLEQRESFRAVLLKCAETAVSRVATMVDYDHKFAWKVAKELGMVGVPQPLHTDPAMVQRVIEMERLEEESRLEQRQRGPLLAPALTQPEVPKAELPNPASGSEALRGNAAAEKPVMPSMTEEEAVAALNRKRGWYMVGHQKIPMADANGAAISK